MELVRSLLNADNYTKLEIHTAYGNMIFTEVNEEKIVLVYHLEQFSPLDMPFGLPGAQGVFQYPIHKNLLRRVGKNTEVYLYNIVSYSKKGVQHKQAVSDMLYIFSKHNLWLKPEKWDFFW